MSPISLKLILSFLFLSGCGSQLNSLNAQKRKSAAPARRVFSLDYEAKLNPQLESKGGLVLPGQKLERWSGRNFIGSSNYEIVPVD